MKNIFKNISLSSNLLKISFAIIMTTALFIGCFFIFNGIASATVTRQTVSATLNGGTSVTVAPGADITATVTGTITGGDSGDWHGTEWRISTTLGFMTCENTNDRNSAGTFTTEAFTITAPSTPGTYNVYFRINGKGSCGPDESGTLLTLNNAVTVTPPPQPDLIANKTNNLGGNNAIVGNVFNWIITITNNGNKTADFGNWDEILKDNLPNSGATYGSPSAVKSGDTTGDVICSRSGNTVTCISGNGSSHRLHIPAGGSITVTIPVTPTSVGSLVNPRADGICMVDPSYWEHPHGNISESNEDNNTCSNTVTVVANAGTIIVKKTMVGGTETFAFTGDPSGSISTNDGTISATVAAGTYTSTETLVSGWDLTSVICDDSDSVGSVANHNATFNVAAGETVTCTFTNTKLPTLTLVKTVNNNYGGTKAVSDFVLKIDDVQVTSGVPKTVSVGVHTASEVNLVGYSASSWGTDCAENGTITLAAGENKVCTIANSDIQPILTIIKHVINDNGGEKLAGDFTMIVSGPTLLSFPGAEAPGITNNVNAGSYTITESGPEGYALSYLGYCNTGGNLSLDIGENKDCTLTNDDKSPHLKVMVHVITDNGGSLLAPETTVNVTGTNVLPKSTFAGDEEGYTVSLDANASYSADANDVTGYNKTLSSECSGTLNLNESRTCTITFDDIQPKLTVTKVVIIDNGGTKTVQDFPLFVGETSVTSDQQNGFDVGTYNIHETGDPGYAATISGDCDAQGDITLQAGDIKSCTITNDDIQPKLTVIKIVINDNGGTKVVADFPLFVGETSVTSGQENGFNAGNYIVSETPQIGYIAAISGDCDTQGNVTLQAGEVKSCTITNDDIVQTGGEQGNNNGGGGGGGGGGGETPYSLESPDAQRVDANRDGKVDILDFNILMVHWGETGGGIGDFNGDGKVDILDFDLLMLYWMI